MTNQVSLKKLVGRGYDGFWNSKATYRMCKGSKGSKKSKTMALWLIYNIMKYPDSNALVIRKTYNTIGDSVFTELLWAIDKLQVTDLWDVKTSPFKLTYNKKQVILFRGMDDAQKIASIVVRYGYLCWVWFEEFFEITNEQEFLKVTMSIRGDLPPETGLWKQFTGTFNPWSEHSWIKEKFFDEETSYPDTYACTTTYKDNEFLGKDDVKRYEDLYITNPRAARIICDGDWGIADGLIYDNWVEENFDYREILKDPDVETTFGLDFGYAASYNAFVAIAVNIEKRKLWVYDEMYQRGMTNLDIARRITEMGYAKELIWADAAEPKSIYELQQGFVVEEVGANGAPMLCRYKLVNVRPAMKGPDSIRNGIANLQSFEMIIHPKCINTIMELHNYSYDQDKDGNFTDKPIKDWDHCLVAGTMVMMGDGSEKEIEKIRPNDVVLTHKGPRCVKAAGITRPVPAHIFKMTLEDGTVIEGTKDHPIQTLRGVVELQNCLGQYVVVSTDDSPAYFEEMVCTIPLQPELNFRRGMESRDSFTDCVRRGAKTGFKLMQVTSVEATDVYEEVYDLTVDDAHDFFANGILVLNCMDAMRYAMAKFFIKGRGMIAEIKGEDNHKRSFSSKRVVSSSR